MSSIRARAVVAEGRAERAFGRAFGVLLGDVRHQQGVEPQLAQSRKELHRDLGRFGLSPSRQPDAIDHEVLQPMIPNHAPQSVAFLPDRQPAADVHEVRQLIAT